MAKEPYSPHEGDAKPDNRPATVQARADAYREDQRQADLNAKVAPSRGRPVEYLVVDNPFFDGVQLHPVGTRIFWAGPPGNSLHPVDGERRRSTTDAPVFPNPLAGRGDGATVAAAQPGQPAIVVQ